MTVQPDFDDPYLIELLKWADSHPPAGRVGERRLPARRRAGARRYGAEGIGLCRTEHMFFETERLPIVQKHDPGQDRSERDKAPARSCCRCSAPTSRACSARWTACR
jgi:pyruvate,orthophosphate dikinase